FTARADPVEATQAFFAGAAQTLRDTDYADACPIATVALEVSSTSEPMRRACAEVFDAWIDGASARLAEMGVPQARSRGLAISLLCALEGAFVLARALRSTEPLESAGEAMAARMSEAGEKDSSSRNGSLEREETGAVDVIGANPSKSSQFRPKSPYH
ncbi:MAG TPA: TetR family transcriptional regulator C-terminal domain-containing protein, partial [Solirubrobacteraceae bacterium]